MKDIIRQSWDIVPVPDTIISRVNILGKYQQGLLVFTDLGAESLDMVMLVSQECIGMGMKMKPH